MSLRRRSILHAGLGFGLAGAGFIGASGIRPARAAGDGPAVSADLIAAAKKEGQINVITPAARLGELGCHDGPFQQLYGVKLDDANPDGSSAEELQAIRSLKSQARAPDVVDVGPSFALPGAKEKLFQPYKVATWNEIPDDVKGP